jgi:hypothetical protein
MEEYRAVCPRILGNELTAAECKNLTGGWPDAQVVEACPAHSASTVRYCSYFLTRVGFL